jgi:hypothetical protein
VARSGWSGGLDGLAGAPVLLQGGGKEKHEATNRCILQACSQNRNIKANRERESAQLSASIIVYRGKEDMGGHEDQPEWMLMGQKLQDRFVTIHWHG